MSMLSVIPTSSMDGRFNLRKPRVNLKAQPNQALELNRQRALRGRAIRTMNGVLEYWMKDAMNTHQCMMREWWEMSDLKWGFVWENQGSTERPTSETTCVNGEKNEPQS